MNYKIVIKKHSDISTIILDSICKLKAIRWPYSLNEHKKWMEQNIGENDYHLLIFKYDELVAYSNFSFVEVIINGEIENFLGVGNVCTKNSGFGLGKIIIKEINNFILKKKCYGLLLCQDSLLSYYEKFSWIRVDQKKILSTRFYSVNFLLFNYCKQVNTFEYKGKNF